MNNNDMIRVAAIAMVSRASAKWAMKCIATPTRVARPAISQKKRRIMRRRIGLFPTRN